MKGVRKFIGGEAVAVATIRRRKRRVTDKDAIAIRDQKMLEMRYRDDLDAESIGKVFCGLSAESVRAGIRRAKAEIAAQRAG